MIAVRAIVPVNELNLDGGDGAKLTARETAEGRTDVGKDVGVEGVEQEKPLAPDDALPQTVYEARRRKGEPILIRIPLRFRVETAAPPLKKPATKKPVRR